LSSKRVIFVLGAPRTGTSAISSALMKLGVDFGNEKNFVDPAVYKHNPKGFFELAWVNQLNDEVFSRLGLCWERFELLSKKALSVASLSQYRLNIREAVTREWGTDGALIGIKDPRISILFPLWESVLSGMGYEPKCIVVLRNPLSYAKSEVKLQKWTTERLLLDWSRHVLSALYFSREFDTRVVDFDEFAAGPKNVVARICKWLDLPSSLVNEAAAVYDKDMYHHCCAEARIPNEFVADLYDWLRSNSGDVRAVSWPTEFYDRMLKIWPILGEVVFEGEREAECVGKEAAVLRRDLEELQDSLVQTVREKDELTGTLVARLEKMELEVTESGQGLRAALEMENRARERMAQCEAELAAIRSSLGWRLLSLYGRIKHHYLLPVYRALGRIKRPPSFLGFC
jgi:hypothetical protein